MLSSRDSLRLPSGVSLLQALTRNSPQADLALQALFVVWAKPLWADARLVLLWYVRSSPMTLSVFCERPHHQKGGSARLANPTDAAADAATFGS